MLKRIGLAIMFAVLCLSIWDVHWVLGLISVVLFSFGWVVIDTKWGDNEIRNARIKRGK